MGFPKGVIRDFTATEKRRIKAVRLVIEEGLSQGVAARRVRAAQQSISGWLRRYREEGHSGLAKAGRTGRKPRLSQEQLAQLETLLLEGPEAHGFPTPLWTCPRVARLIRDRFGVRYHDGHVWKLLRALNWSPQRLADKARERKERGRGEAGPVVRVSGEGYRLSSAIARPWCWCKPSRSSLPVETADVRRDSVPSKVRGSIARTVPALCFRRLRPSSSGRIRSTEAS